MSSDDSTHYDVLEVGHDAGAETIRRAYRSLIRKVHPDMPTGDADRAAAVQVAYTVLADSTLRAEYDRSLKDAAAAAKKAENTSTADTEPSWGQTSTQWTGEEVQAEVVDEPGTHTAQPGPDLNVEHGPVSLSGRPLWKAWPVLLALAVAGLVAWAGPGMPVTLTAAFIGLAVAVYALAPTGLVSLVRSGFVVLAVLPLAFSIDPISGWVGAWVWPMVAAAGAVALWAGVDFVTKDHRLRKATPFTDTTRVVGTVEPHSFIANLARIPGWVAVTGPGRWGTALVNGRDVILIATVAPVSAGTTFSWTNGQLLRQRSGSTVGMPEPGLDLIVSGPPAMPGEVTAVVFAPGYRSAAGADLVPPVLGEEGLVSLMASRGGRSTSRTLIDAVCQALNV